LPLLVFWARKSNWFVVYIPDGEKWVNFGDYIEKSPESTPERSLWDQPQLAYKFFNDLLDAHGDKLKLISIKTKYAPHIHRVDLASRSTHSLIHSFILYRFTIGKLQAKTLFDLVEFGAALIQFSSQAFLHFRDELYRITEYEQVKLLFFERCLPLHDQQIPCVSCR